MKIAIAILFTVLPLMAQDLSIPVNKPSMGAMPVGAKQSFQLTMNPAPVYVHNGFQTRKYVLGVLVATYYSKPPQTNMVIQTRFHKSDPNSFSRGDGSVIFEQFRNGKWTAFETNQVVSVTVNQAATGSIRARSK